MKKIITWIMLVAMLLGMFAGCGQQSADPTQAATTAPVEIPEVTTVTENNALDVINYLQAIYTDGGAKTSGDFQRFGIVRIAGVPYTVEWTVNVGADKITVDVNDDGTVTINVNEKCTEDTPYVLTATITDANGNTETASWEYLLPGVASLEEMQAIVDQAYSLEVGEAMTEEVTLAGVITTIDSPWSEQYKNITVTIAIEGREDKTVQCYRLKGDGAQDLVPGDTIAVQGLIKNYNNTIEFDAGCQIVYVEKTGTPIVIPTDFVEILDDVYALGNNEALPYGPVSLTGNICSIDTAYSEQYGNITVTIQIGYYTIKCYRMTGAGIEDLEMNDVITVKGYVKKYNGTREFDKPELVEVVKKVGAYPQPKDNMVTLKAAYALDPAWMLPYSPVTLTGTITKAGSWSDEYENVTVTMVVDGDTKGEYPISCYRMSYSDKATKQAIKSLEKGDKITVRGMIINHMFTKSGETQVQFTYPELLKVQKGEKVESNLTATLTTELKTGDNVVIAAPAHKKALSSVYSGYYNKGQDITIENNIAKGFTEDEIWTVTKNSDGTYSFSVGGQKLSMDVEFSSMPLGKTNDKWALEPVSEGVYKVKNVGRNAYIEWYKDKNNWSSYSKASSDLFHISFYKYEGELSVKDPAADSTLTVAEAIALGASKDHDEYTSGKYYVTGEITEIYNAKFGNMKIKDASGNILTIYGTFDSTGANSFEAMTTKPVVGDTVKLYGKIGQYNNTPQMKNAWIMVINNSGSGSGSGSEGGNEGGSTTENVYMTSAPKNGDKVVIVAPSHNKALSTQPASAGSYYQKGVDVSVSNGKLTGYANTEVWTVVVNADGSYSFENGGKNIGMQDSFASMSLGAVNDDWTLVSLSNGLFNIKNVKRGNIIEWYAEKNNWSSYASTSAATDPLFQLAFYLVEAGSGSGSGSEGGNEGGNEGGTESTLEVSKISDALAAAKDTKLMVKGVVTLVDGKNIYVQDETGAICVRMDTAPTDIKLGETIIATGVKADKFKGLPQITGQSYEKSSGVSLKAEVTDLDSVQVDEYLCKYITIKDLTVTEIDGTNVTLTDVAVDTSVKWYKAVMPADLKVGDVVTFTGALSIFNDYQLRNSSSDEIVVTAQGGSGEGDEPTGEPVTVNVKISDYATANGWQNSKQYKTLKMDDVVSISLTCSGNNNTGKYYTKGNNWRIYQNESPKITFTAAEGKTIVSVKITYSIEKTGILTLNGSNITSGTTVEVNASTVTFGVGNTGTVSNGQVRITAIEVVYQ